MNNDKRRPDGVTIAALWYMVLAAGAAFGACVAAVPASLVSLNTDIPTGGRFVATVLLGFGITAAVVIAVLFAIIGWGLWKLREWGRIGALVGAIFHLPFFPVGTAIGVAQLWYLSSHQEVLTAFRGAPPAAP